MARSKPELIILPGWAGDSSLWQHQCVNLTDLVTPKVIVVTEQPSIEKMAEEVLSSASEKFILLGHSLGGLIAQWIAIHHPHKVNKLILLATWTGFSSPELVTFFKKMLQKIRNDERESLWNDIKSNLVYSQHDHRENLLQTIHACLAQFPTQGLINQTLAEINAIDTSPLLHKIQCPTLIIHGRQDAFFPLQIHEHIRDHIANAKLTIIETCGHMLSIEQPEAITALIRLWVQ
ncbi:MAG TPA: alpha/beta hydrolase [Gammaproteobacteria bacterium]|nr:alpha/beta hydrolase [Gammaproteobacteria bacterium]